MLSRDQMIESALGRAALEYRASGVGDGLVASFDAASHEFPEGAPFLVDAPPGWLRIATVLERTHAPSTEELLAANTLVWRTGFGQVQWDERIPGYRFVVHLLAAREPPTGASVIGAIQHLLLLHAGFQRGEGDPAYVDDVPAENRATLESVVVALGDTLPFTWQVDGSFVAETVDRRGAGLHVRARTMVPGVFVFDALAGRPRQLGPEVVRWLHRLNATAVTAGSLVRGPDGRVQFVWACPYVCLDAEELRTNVLVETARQAASSLRYASDVE